MKPSWDDWPEARQQRLPLFDVALTLLIPVLAFFTAGPIGFVVFGVIVYLDFMGVFDRHVTR